MVIRPDDAVQILTTSSEVIDAVGGTTPAAKIAFTTPQAANNWRRSGYFPSGTFLIFSEELKARGKRASVSLWRMKPSRSVQFAGQV